MILAQHRLKKQRWRLPQCPVREGMNGRRRYLRRTRVMHTRVYVDPMWHAWAHIGGFGRQQLIIWTQMTRDTYRFGIQETACHLHLGLKHRPEDVHNLCHTHASSFEARLA